MALTAAQRTSLATEINTDPKSLGYSPGSKNNVQIAAIINTVGASNEKLAAGVIPSYQVANAFVNSEIDALIAASPTLPSKLLLYLATGQIDTNTTTGANTRAAFLAMFPNGTAPTTRANLIALVDRLAARAEILFGVGVVVLVEDVSAALNRSV